MSKTSKSKNGILLITYAFPPIKAISSIRNYSIATHFQSYFSEVRVLSTTNRKRFPKEVFPYEEKLVYESLTFDYRTPFPNKKSSGVNQMPKDPNSFLTKLKNSFPFNLIIGLGGCFYIFFGVILGVYIVRKHKPTHIFSSFKPYADHVIGFWLKTFFPKLVWIADYNNLHIDPGRNNLYFIGLQKWFDNTIASKADYLSTVSQGLVKHLKVYNENVIVLENGIINPESSLESSEYCSDGKFTISYTGSLYPHQSSESFLQTLKNLIDEGKINKEKLQILYAGASSNLWNLYAERQGMESFCKDLGVLPFDEARKIQQGTNINLLLTWTTDDLDGIIPAKFYDYLASKRNIILIIKGNRDPLWEEKFKDLGIKGIFYDEPAAMSSLADHVFEIYSDWVSEGNKNISYPDHQIKKYYWENMMADFIKKIKKEA